jgi:hypothetical protein
MRVVADTLIEVTNPASTTTSKSVTVEHLPYVAVWVSGTAITGTANIQGSVDNENFVTVQAVTLSGSGQLFNLPNVGWHWLRITVPSGTGTVSAKYSAKGV